MEGSRSRAHGLAQELAAAWLAGDHGAVASACTADVCWWTPMDDDASGPSDTSAALRRVLAPLQEPVEVTAVVPSDDGRRCVVEMRSAATPPQFVTSVLSLRDGRVAAGRTYTDLPRERREAEAS